MKEQIFNKIVQLVSTNNHIPAERITIDSTFEELDMDSLDGITLINDLESEYSITLPNDEAVKIRSVRNAVESLDKIISQ